MQFLKHDAELVRLLERSDSEVARARSNDDLLQIIDNLKSFKGGLTFDHALPLVLLLLAIVSAIPAMAGVIWMWFATGCLGFASLYTWMSRANVIDDLPKKIARKCSFLSNGLRDPGGSADERFQRLSEEFDDYDRGNDSRRIKDSAKGVYQGTLHQLSFVFHHLYYVNSRDKTDSDGKTERIYTGFDRYSLVVDFPWVKGVKARTHPSNKKRTKLKGFDTTSDEFNRVFSLSGESELACAKFATPTTMAFLLNLSRRLTNVNLEFSDQGRLCLSFDNPEVMAYKDPGTLKDLPAFYANIKQGLELPGLFPVLALVHELAELHDNNFEPALKATDQMER